MKLIHVLVDKLPYEKCNKCNAVSMDATCLLKDKPRPRTKDGTCNLRIINNHKSYEIWVKENDSGVSV